MQFGRVSFGALIAFLLPGFVGLWGVSFLSPRVQSWISGPGSGAPPAVTVLMILLASLAVGLVISAIRWSVIDRLLHHTGTPAPVLDFSKIKGCLQEFEAIVENHFKYYQYYSHTFIALLFSFTVRQVKLWQPPCSNWILFLGVLVTLIALFLASRDALSKCYERSKALL